MLCLIAAKAQVILLVFHHLAPHNCKITTPTEKKLSDRSILDQCLGVVDAVFWNGSMYDCDANEKAINQTLELLNWRIPMKIVIKLTQLIQL